MIYDRLVNISRYLGLHKNLDTAIRFLMRADIAALPEGRTEIDGDQVYANVMQAVARPAAGLRYEIHKRHMDIQIDLSGTEIINTGSSGMGFEMDLYNEETDFAFASCENLASCTVGPGNFIICMPGEPHMPGVAAQEDTALKKCVVKVSV